MAAALLPFAAEAAPALLEAAPALLKGAKAAGAAEGAAGAEGASGANSLKGLENKIPKGIKTRLGNNVPNIGNISNEIPGAGQILGNSNGNGNDNESKYAKAWKVFKKVCRVLFGILLLISLLPIVPFWVITYYSFWGKYGILRFAVNNFRNI